MLGSCFVVVDEAGVGGVGFRLAVNGVEEYELSNLKALSCALVNAFLSSSWVINTP